jgi:hypothetical protein
MGELRLKIPGQPSISKNFRLYRDCLVYKNETSAVPQWDKGSDIMTGVMWKRLVPFVEDLNTGEQRFGFRLLGSNQGEDFYARSEEELGIWLSHLSRVAI